MFSLLPLRTAAVLLTAFFCPVLHAETAAIAWKRTYDSPPRPYTTVEGSNKAALDAHGNAFVLGTTDSAFGKDVRILKHAAAGGPPAWTVEYNGPYSGDDEPVNIVADAAGDVIVSVACTYQGSRLSYTAKYAGADGALLWSDIRDGTAATMEMDSSGNVTVASRIFGDQDTSWRTFRLSSSGGLLWDRIRDAPGERSNPLAVALDSAGNAIVTGTISRTAPDGMLGSYIHTMKYASADGALLWEKEDVVEGMHYNYPWDIELDAEGNPVICGSVGPEFGNATYYVMKCSGVDGSPLWRNLRVGGAGGLPAAVSVKLDAAGNVFTTGYRTDENYSNNYFYLTVKYSPGGSLLWEKRHVIPNYSGRAGGMILDAAGDAYVPGYAHPTAGGPGISSLLKYRGADGELLWDKTGLLSIPFAFNASGNLMCVGSSGVAYTPMLLTEYQPADGTIVSQSSYYNGTRGQEDQTSAILTDPAGNVITTGVSGTRLRTVKRSPSGNIIWEKEHDDGTGYVPDKPVMALDTAGNVVVSGGMREPSDTSWVTVKYAAADGRVLWEKRFGAADGVDDRLAAIAIAANNDVIVSGAAGSGDSYFDPHDIMTIRYAAADGAMVWQNRYNRPEGNGDDIPKAMALDAEGNVVVAGTSVLFSYTTDVVTLKYNPAGDLLWSRRWEAPGTPLLSLDAGGNIILTSRWDSDYYGLAVRKYTQGGDVGWQKDLPSPPGEVFFQPSSMVVDENDDIILMAGDGSLLHLDAADGRVAWMVKEQGPAQKWLVALDAAGNPVVGGHLMSGYDQDLYVAKRSRIDGSLLWSFTNGGAMDSEQTMEALAPDASGNVYAAGMIKSRSYDTLLVKLETTAPLAVLSSADIPIPNGGVISLGSAGVGSGTGENLRLRNNGTQVIPDLTFHIEGANASEFSFHTIVPAGIAPGADFVIGVGFSPAETGPRTAILRIASHGGDGEKYIIQLTGVGHLTNSHDQDGDGLGDLVESKLMELGLDWKTADPEKIALIRGNAHLAGLFSPEKIHRVRLGTPGITRTGNQVELSLSLKQSSDGSAWAPLRPASAVITAEGGVNLHLPAPDGTRLLHLDAP